MRDRVGEVFRVLIGMQALWVTHQEHKKSAGLIRRRKSSAETFIREIALSHIDPLGQDTLPSPMAGCRIRISESLLMLEMKP
jgi:hypothetical protein